MIQPVELEELGFKKNPFMDFYEKRYSNEWMQVITFYSKFLTVEFVGKDRMASMLVFKGVIKNIHEMERLLNQVDIVY